MNLFGLMQTSGSAMQAERMRAEVVASNMANAETTRTEGGGPYRRHMVVFAANQSEAGFRNLLNSNSLNPDPTGFERASSTSSSDNSTPGVHIAAVVEDTSAPLERYDPGHPDAGPNGFVSYPDINPLTEMVDLMGASRAYGLNGSAVQAEKGMIVAALEIAKA
jgi:flagellar basal-body rod protein FlgC